MLDFLKPVLDVYDRNVRLKPGLLSGLPVVASTVLLIPEVGVVWSAIGGMVLYSGGSMLLMQVSRDRGQSLEARLYESWGGKPSVTMLRHSDDRLDRATKERYRRFLNAAVPSLALPSVEEEQNSPERADGEYESANAWLLEQTRDHDRFALLFRENMNYGFRRNLAGLRPLALVMAAVAFGLVLGWAAAWWIGLFPNAIEGLTAEWWMSLAMTTGHSLFFFVRIKAEWVRLAADLMAGQLRNGVGWLCASPLGVFARGLQGRGGSVGKRQHKEQNNDKGDP